MPIDSINGTLAAVSAQAHADRTSTVAAPTGQTETWNARPAFRRRPRFAKAALFAAALGLATTGAVSNPLYADVEVTQGTTLIVDDLQGYGDGTYNLRGTIIAHNADPNLITDIGATIIYTGGSQNVNRGFTAFGVNNYLVIQDPSAVITATGNFTGAGGSGNDSSRAAPFSSVTKSGPGTLIMQAGSSITIDEGLLIFGADGSAGSSMYQYYSEDRSPAYEYDKDYALIVKGTGKVRVDRTAAYLFYFESGLMVKDNGQLDFNGYSGTQLAYIDGTGDGLITNSNLTSQTIITLGDTTNQRPGRAQHRDSIYSGQITGNIAITKIADGSLRFSGRSTYTGPTNITSGSIILTGNGGIEGSTINLSNAGGIYFDISGIDYRTAVVYQLTGDGNGSGAILLGTNYLQIGKPDQIGDFTYSGSIGNSNENDTGGIIKEGLFKFTLNSSSGGGDRRTRYQGETVINQGTLALVGTHSVTATMLALSSGVTLNTDSDALAVFDISGITGSTYTTIKTLTGGGEVILGNKTLVLSGNGDSNFSGAFSGYGASVEKQGIGTLKLTGNSSFEASAAVGSYAFLISGGILEFDHTGGQGGNGALGSNTLRYEYSADSVGPSPDRLTDLIGFATPSSILRFDSGSSGETHALLQKGLRAEASALINIDVPNWYDELTVPYIDGDVVKTGPGTLIYGDLEGADTPENNSNSGKLTIEEGTVVLAKTTGVAVTGDAVLHAAATGDSVLRFASTDGNGSGNQITNGDIVLSVGVVSLSPLRFGTTLNLNGQNETLEDASGNITKDVIISGTGGTARIINETDASAPAHSGTLVVRNLIKENNNTLAIGSAIATAVLTISADTFTSNGGIWAFGGTGTAAPVLTANSEVGGRFEVAATTVFTGTATLDNLSLVGIGSFPDLTLGEGGITADITLVGASDGFGGAFIINSGSTLNFATPYAGLPSVYAGGVSGGGTIVQKGVDTVVIGDGTGTQSLQADFKAESGRLLIAGDVPSPSTAQATGTGILAATDNGRIAVADASIGGTVLASGTGVITTATADGASAIGVESGGTIVTGQVDVGGVFLSGEGTVTSLTLGTGAMGPATIIRPSPTGGNTGAIVETITITGTIAVDALGAAGGVANHVLDFPSISYRTASNPGLTPTDVASWAIHNTDLFRQSITIEALPAAVDTDYTLVVLKFDNKAFGDIVWNGETGRSTWNYYSGNQVWLTNDITSAPDWFHVGDNVTFPAGAQSKEVQLVGDLYPSSIHLEVNDGETYRFYNANNVAGKISGPATLEKLGLGELRIETPNDNTGSITLKGGTVSVSSAASIGAGEVKFEGDNITLTVESIRSFLNPVSVVGAGNTLVLGGQFDGGSLTVSGTSSTLSLTIPSGSSFGGVFEGDPVSGGGTVTLEGSALQVRTFPNESPDFNGTLIGVAGEYIFRENTGSFSDWLQTNFETAGSNPTLTFTDNVSIAEFTSLDSGTIQISKTPSNSDPSGVLDIATGRITRAANSPNVVTITGGEITVPTASSDTLTINTNGATGRTNFAATFGGAGSTLDKTGEGDLRLADGAVVGADFINVKAGKLELVKGASLANIADTREIKVGMGLYDPPAILRFDYTGVLADDGDAFALNSSKIVLGNVASEWQVAGYNGTDTAGAARTVELSGTGIWRVTGSRFGLNASTIALDSSSEIIVEDSNGIWHNAITGGTDWSNNFAKLTLNDGILDLHGGEVEIGGLEGNGAVMNSSGVAIVSGGTHTLTFGKSTQTSDSYTFSGKINAGASTGANGTVLGGAVNGNTTYTHAPVNLVKTGDGTQIFTGSVFSNTLTINQGIVQFGDATSDFTYTPAGGNALIENNGQLIFVNALPQTVNLPGISAGGILGIGSLEKKGVGALSFTGSTEDYSYSGATLVREGSLAFNKGLSDTSHIEITPGSTLSVGEGNTVVLNGSTPGKNLSYAGHSRSLINPPAADITGNLTLKDGHILQVGADQFTALNSADFAELKISGDFTLAGSLTENTLLFDLINPLNHDTITVGGVFDVTAAPAQANITLGTVDDILMPGEYTLITAGSFGAGVVDSVTATATFQGGYGDITAALGLIGTPSLENKLEVEVVGSKTLLKLVVAGTGVTYTWNKSAAGAPTTGWDHGVGNQIWVKHDPRSSVTTDPSHYDAYGNVVFVEDSALGLATEVLIRDAVHPLEILVKDADILDSTFTGYTICNTFGDTGFGTTGRIDGPGKLTKTSSGTLTLNASEFATHGHSFTGAVSVEGGTLLVSNVQNHGVIPVIGDIGGASLIGAGLSALEHNLYGKKSAGDLLLKNGATLALESQGEVSTNRSFTVGTDGAVIQVLGDRVTFRSTADVELEGADGTNGRVLEINTAAGDSEAVFTLKFGPKTLPPLDPTHPSALPYQATLTLKKTGDGTLWLNGTENTAPVLVEGGRLSINNSGAAGSLTLSGGVLSNVQPTGFGSLPFTFTNPVSFIADSIIEVEGSTNVLSLDGAISGVAGTTLTKTSTGILALRADNSATLDAGARLTVSEGVLRLTNRNASGKAHIHLEGEDWSLSKGAGNLQTGTAEVEVAGLSGEGFVSNPAGGTTRALVVNIAQGGTSLFSGSFQDGPASLSNPAKLALRKIGAGTLALDGTGLPGTATGTVTVENGILQLRTTNALAATPEFLITSGTSFHGTLDIYGNDISSSAAIFSGTGNATVLDSQGNSTFPGLVLNASGTVTTASSSYLSTASSTAANVHTLTLAPDVAPTTASDVARIYTFSPVVSAGVLSNVKLDINPGATLRLDRSGLLVATTAVKLNGTGPDGNSATDATLFLTAGTTQVVTSLTGTGTLAGDAGGVFTVSTMSTATGAEKTFAGTLRDSVSLTVRGAGLTLAPSLGVNETDGTITIDGSVLRLVSPLATTGVSDVLGKRDSGTASGSKVVFNNGVLASDSPVLSSTDRAFTLNGASSTFRSEGTGGLHITAAAALTVDSSTGHTLILDGTNGTPGDFAPVNFLAAYLADSSSGGALALKKTGTGTWFIGQGAGNPVSTNTGGTFVENGTLVLATPDAITGTLVLGVAGINTSGALKLNGNDLTLSGLSVLGEGASNRVYNGLAGTTPTLTLAVAAGAPTTYAGILGKVGDDAANSFHFVKDGPGTLVLHLDVNSSFLPTATYTGDTTVKAGTLSLSGTTHLTSRRITVASGATLDARSMAGDFGISVEAGQRFTAGGIYNPAHFDVLGNLTLNGGDLYVGSELADAPARVLNMASGDSTLRVRTESGVAFTLSSSLQGNNSLLYAKNLSFDTLTNVTVFQADGTLAIGSYKLADYSSIRGAGNLRLTDAVHIIGDGRYEITLNISSTSSPGSIYLNVLSTASVENALLWVGDVAIPGPLPSWDSHTENFAKADGSRASYFPGETAIFDDSAVGTNITVGMNTSIGFAIFANNNQDYTISGQPILGEGWIEKRGIGVLTLLSANDYVGTRNANGINNAATYLVQGTLEAGHDRALGTGALNITGASTLRAVNGARTLANAIVLNSGVTATLDAGNDGLILTGSLSGDSASRIFKTGTGVLQPAPDGSNYRGLISAETGTIRLVDAQYGAATFQLGFGGATLEISGSTEVGELRGEIASRLLGSGELKTGARNANSNFQGDASGTFALRKVGTGTLTLTGDLSAHSGPSIVQQGSLRIGDGLSGTLGTGSFTVAGGGSLVFNLPTGASIAQDISSAGFVEKQGTAELEITGTNADLAGQVRISGGVLRLAGSGTLGTADIEIRGGTLLLARSGDYTLLNNISGAGELVKDDNGAVTWLGTGETSERDTVRGVNIHVQNGTFAIGNGGTPLEQVQLQTTRVDAGAALVLAPAPDGTVTLGDVESDTGAVVLKTGGGKATLTAYVRANGGIHVAEGTLAIGDGQSTGEITIPGALNVSAGATLEFNRDSTIHVSGRLVGDGAIQILKGETILQNAANAISGSLAIAPGAILQVGDAGRASLLGTGPLTAAVSGGATLRFVNTAGDAPLSTGSTLAITGTGIVEYRSTGTLRQNSDTAAFTGTFLASHGTFVFDAAASLPAAATLDAAGEGVLKIESADATATLNAPKFGTGDGTILLAPGNPGQSTTFTFAGNSAFANGILAVDSGATLHLVNTNVLGAKELVIRPGATLDGAGTLQGSLRNDGVFAPGSAVNISGDFINTGLLIVSITASGTSSVHFGGVTTIAPSSTLRLDTTPAIYQQLLDGKEIQFLHDTAPGAGGKVQLSGAFLPDNITILVNDVPVSAPALTYSKGDGWLTMIISDNIRDIPDVRAGLHDGLRDFAGYLNDTLREDGGALSAAVGAMLGAPDGVVKAINGASPVGLASITGMALGTAHDDAANLHSHLEASRFSRFNLKSPHDTEVYFTGTGNYEQNSGRSGPAYDYNSYGGTVGIDQAVGTQFLAGLAAGYHKNRATLDYGAGSVAQDNARLTAYATVQFTESLYADIAIHGGYTSNDIKHRTTGGTAYAEPESYDFGATLAFGSAFGLTKGLSLTPYVEAEYNSTHVNAFTEKAGHGYTNAAALHLDRFSQESLRAKIGTGINWLVPVRQLRTFRVSLDVAYAYELLDTDLDLDGRFATDFSGRSFSISVPEQSRHILQLGPTVDVGLTERMNFQLGYRFESNFEHQTSHHLNATFRVRF